jgi:hypothetical protein
MGLGIFDSAEAGLTRFPAAARTIVPSDVHAPVYDGQFVAYQRLARKLAV